MRSRLCAVAALSLALPLAVVRADEPAPPAKPAPAAPEGPPTPRPAITHAYLKSLAGTWDITAILADGAEKKGSSTIRLDLDGTAVVNELTGAEGYFGLGVLYVGADAKSVSSWYFDTAGPGQVWATKGELAEKGYVLHTEGGPMGPMKETMNAEEGGHVYEMWAGEHRVMSIHYKNRKDPQPRAAIARDKGQKSALIDGLLGDWVVEGVTVIEALKVEMRHTGATSFRLALGGTLLAQDYEARNDLEHNVGLAINALGADGKTLTHWSFWNTFDRPMVMKGTVEGATFRAKAEGGPMPGMETVHRTIEGGHELVVTFEIPGIGKGVSTETYKKAAK